MKIRVDPEKCQGHARCYGLAPEIFDVDDYGQASVILDDVPPELRGEGPARRGQLPRVRHRDHQRLTGRPEPARLRRRTGPEVVGVVHTEAASTSPSSSANSASASAGAAPPDEGEGAHGGHRQHDGAEGEGRRVAVDGAGGERGHRLPVGRHVGHRGAGGDGVDERGAQGAAGLLGGVDQCAGHAGVLRVHADQGRAAHGHEGQAHAEADDHLGRQHDADVGRSARRAWRRGTVRPWPATGLRS